jgi:hypothetical protein
MGALVRDGHRGVVCAAALALALIASACFEPSESDGVVACGEGEACPPGFACRLADQRCYRDPPLDDIDGAPVEVDGAPVEVDGAPVDIDGAPIDVDGAPDDPDASAPPDAGEDAGVGEDAGDEATEFCDSYELVCGFAGNNNRYDDFDACVTSFDSYDEGRKACVESELEQAESATGGARNAHCSAAAGNEPCN